MKKISLILSILALVSFGSQAFGMNKNVKKSLETKKTASKKDSYDYLILKLTKLALKTRDWNWLGQLHQINAGTYKPSKDNFKDADCEKSMLSWATKNKHHDLVHNILNFDSKKKG